MNLESDLEYYVENPDRLLDLCREVLERLDTGAGGEEAKQLQAVCAAIEQLERQGITVTDGLRAEKLRLAEVQASHEAASGKLQAFVEGLGQLARDATLRLMRNKPTSPRKPRSVTSARKTPTETLRQLILEVLEAKGGQATSAEVYEAIAEHMQGRFLPGDLEMIKRNLNQTWPSWQNSARQERTRMAQDGLLRNDSPKGLWELNK